MAANLELERKGSRVGFITTGGFGDVLAIGRERQPFVRQRNGKWLDQRVPFARSDRLLITKGPHAGKVAKVDSRFAQMRVDGQWE